MAQTGVLSIPIPRYVDGGSTALDTGPPSSPASSPPLSPLRSLELLLEDGGLMSRDVLGLPSSPADSPSTTTSQSSADNDPAARMQFYWRCAVKAAQAAREDGGAPTINDLVEQFQRLVPSAQVADLGQPDIPVAFVVGHAAIPARTSSPAQRESTGPEQAKVKKLLSKLRKKLGKRRGTSGAAPVVHVPAGVGQPIEVVPIVIPPVTGGAIPVAPFVSPDQMPEAGSFERFAWRTRRFFRQHGVHIAQGALLVAGVAALVGLSIFCPFGAIILVATVGGAVFCGECFSAFWSSSNRAEQRTVNPPQE